MSVSVYMNKCELIDGSAGKESACNPGDLSLIPGLGRSPGRGYGNPLEYSCLEDLHGQRSLAGKESDITQLLSTARRSTLCYY